MFLGVAQHRLQVCGRVAAPGLVRGGLGQAEKGIGAVGMLFEPPVPGVDLDHEGEQAIRCGAHKEVDLAVDRREVDLIFTDPGRPEQ